MSTNENINWDDRTKLAEALKLEEEALLLEQGLRLKTRQFKDSTLSLVGPIAPAIYGGTVSSAETIKGLNALWRMDSNLPREQKRRVFLNINSSAGMYSELFAIYDFIRMMQADGHKFTGQVSGSAVQHAAMLLQVCDERVMMPSSWLELNEATFPNRRGDTSEADHKDMIKYQRDLENSGPQILIDRSEGKIDMPTLLTNTKKQTWYFDAHDAVKIGLADRVGVVLNPAERRQPSDLLPTEADSLDVRLAKATIRVERAKMGVTALDNQSMAEDKFPTLQFFTPVTSGSCAEAIEVIGQFAGRPDTTLRFLINSPGGEVQSGLGLMDVMDEVIASGTKIETVALGEAASMGGFLLQSGTTRRMGKHARLLIHRISSIFGGTNTEQEEAAARMLEIQTRAMPRLSNKSKMSVEEVLAMCEGKDYWMHADEAETKGFIDDGGII